MLSGLLLLVQLCGAEPWTFTALAGSGLTQPKSYRSRHYGAAVDYGFSRLASVEAEAGVYARERNVGQGYSINGVSVLSDRRIRYIAPVWLRLQPFGRGRRLEPFLAAGLSWLDADVRYFRDARPGGRIDVTERTGRPAGVFGGGLEVPLPNGLALRLDGRWFAGPTLTVGDERFSTSAFFLSGGAGWRF